MKMDITMKGQARKVDKEVAVFSVENGKIVSEHFFYPSRLVVLVHQVWLTLNF